MNISRRGFLGAFGAGAAGMACHTGWRGPETEATSLAIAKPPVPGAELYATGEERWFTTACAQCPAACGLRVRVVEGRAVRIEGDPASPVNQGGVGPRGLSSLQALYDPDRLTGPMIRRGGALVPITWDDAQAELAAALTALRATAPERLLVWCGHERGPVHELFARFARAFGTPNFVDGRPGRTGVIAQAMDATIGAAEAPVYGWDDARFVLSLEAGLVEDSCQSVYFTRVAAARRRGSSDRAHLVHAGPMFDLCAYDSDEWLPIAPGTSGALALGLAALLLERAPDALPPSSTTNADALRALVVQFPPPRVEAVTGIPAATLFRLADELWQTRPAIAIVDERSLAYANGLDTARAALALNAVLGAFWQPQGGVRTAPVAPLTAWPAVAPDDVARRGLATPRIDRAGTPAFPRATSVHETLPDAFVDPARRPQIALLHHANPAYARAQPARWHKALAELPMIVSFSPYRDETVDRFAHLVLPDHTFLERWEPAIPAPAIDRAVIALRVPAVRPLHATRASTDVVLALGQAIGGAVADALPWRTWRDASLARLDDQPRIADALHRHGVWVADADAAPAAPPVTVALPSAWREPSWDGDPARFPLGLIAYRPLGYAEGSGANQTWLRTLRPHPKMRPGIFTARVHPESARGLADGQTIAIESPYGSIEAAVVLDERMARGFVAVPMGGGHTAFGRFARGAGANVLDLVRPGPAPDSGADAICTTRVRLIGGAA